MLTKLISSEKVKLTLILSLLCFTYGYLITFNNQIFNNITTIFFIFLSLIVGYKIYLCSDKEIDSKKALRFLLISAFAINFFIIIGTAISLTSEPIFWVVDSYEMHIPGSVRLMKIFQGDSLLSIERSSIYDRTYIAHVMGSVFFSIFGVNHIASSLSLIIPKLICAFFIYKGTTELLSEKHGRLAVVLYSFLPTVIFYTTTFYKEAPLQMLVAMIIFFIIKSYKEFKVKYLLILIILFGLLGNERHYLVPCFALSAILFAILSKNIKMQFKILIFLICVAGYFIFTSYYWDVEFGKMKQILTIFKSEYSKYADVTPLNKSLPYPALILKLLFTPFVTPVKLQTYTHFATLITWGSLIYNLLACFFIVALYRLFKTRVEIRLITILLIPFVFFMLIFGYVAPYNGRLRDSFIPLIVMIASVSIKRFLDEKNKVNENKSLAE